MFLSCITGKKKKDATYIISKSQGPTGIQGVFYCSSFLLLSVFFCGEEISLLLFLQSKSAGTCPSPATALFAGFCHKPWFLQETVSGAMEQTYLFATPRRKSPLTPLLRACSTLSCPGPRDVALNTSLVGLTPGGEPILGLV